MTGAARVLFVAFDACDPAIALALAGAGRMPVLAKLLGTGTHCPVRNPHGLFVGALWMTFATGLRPDRHGFYCWDEIDVGSYRRRLTSPDRAKGVAFWRRLGEAGRRVAVLDVPHSRANAPVNGLQLVEWGCHDRHFGFHSWPAGEAARIERAFGLHPVFGADPYRMREFAPDDYVHRSGARRTPAEERLLLADLLSGLEAKRRLSAALLAEGDWALFVTVFGESHAVGHQQWHLHDRAHPRFDSAALEAVGGDPLAAVYECLDSALGELLSRVDGQTRVILLLSHGMGPHIGGTHLLDEILRRLDLAWDAGPFRGRPSDMMDRAMRRLLGGAGLRGLGLTLPEARALAARRPPWPSREFVSRGERARQRFFMEPNNSVVGGVRLNLAGREPRGRVGRQDAAAIGARLAQDLAEVIDLDSGRPAVRAVEWAERWYRRCDEDSMPDLFVEWDREALVNLVWSPKIGIVHAPYTNWRTGDHHSSGLLVAAGPGLPSGALLPEIALEDLAPSLAAQLGVSLDDIDGRPIDWLAGVNAA